MVSCSNDPLDIDASDVQVDLEFINMDSVFVHSDPDQLLAAHRAFQQEIGEIYEYELGYCLRIGSADDSTVLNSISLFVQDPFIKRVEKRIVEKFNNLSPFKTKIIDGFKHLKYHLPSKKLPESIVFMNSVFVSSAFSTEKQIGIGIERYLGSDTDVIKELPPSVFFEWVKEGMDPKFLVRDAISSWVMTHYVPEVDGNLAENIIRWGKILYLTEAALPDESEAIIPRYSEEDYKWALDNEYSLWKYLVDQKMLFRIDERNKNNMLGDGPFTPGLPEKGPDRLGQFLGWRMVRKYMEIKDITVEELIKTPYTEIIVEYEID